MSKAFILTCTNEESGVISVEMFPSSVDARNALQASYSREIKDANSSGWNEEEGTLDCRLYNNTAYVWYGETNYNWRIHKVEFNKELFK